MKVLFLHGWQSVPGGVKPTFLARHGHEVVNPKLPDDDFEQAVRIAQAEFDKHKPGTVICHSRADDVVPFADSEELVKNSGIPPWTLIEVSTDHRLADPESLEMMLEACVVDDEDEADDILGRDWTGLCYTAALRWVREADDRDWLVVHGTVLSERAGKRIEHAWCERGDVMEGLAMPVGARVIWREKIRCRKQNRRILPTKSGRHWTGCMSRCYGNCRAWTKPNWTGPCRTLTRLRRRSCARCCGAPTTRCCAPGRSVCCAATLGIRQCGEGKDDG